MTADRSKSLARIRAVQDDLVKLARWRLSQAERAQRELTTAKSTLDGFIEGPESAGAPLAEAALRSLKTVGKRLALAENERRIQHGKLDDLLRRDQALDAACRRASLAARRAQEARDLRDVLEAWNAARSAEP